LEFYFHIVKNYQYYLYFLRAVTRSSQRTKL
jgi:hypothetical protein